jgi:hypothetical protein
MEILDRQPPADAGHSLGEQILQRLRVEQRIRFCL